MMNLMRLYVIPSGVPVLDLEVVRNALDAQRFCPCGPTQQHASGWVAPRGVEHGALVESIDGHWHLMFQVEDRIVPASVLARRVDEIAADIEKSTGRKPGRKHRKELREQALLELLPHAFTKCSAVKVWIDRKHGFVVLDAGSGKRADEVITALIKAVDGLAMGLLQTEQSPSVCMSHWLKEGESPTNFSVDRDCRLESCDEMKSVVRYSRHTLDLDEVKAHLVGGKVATELGMTWRDRVSFALSSALVLKKVKFLDVVFEGRRSGASEVKGEAFDADAAIFTGEMVELVADLIEGLGGRQCLEQASSGAVAAAQVVAVQDDQAACTWSP